MTKSTPIGCALLTKRSDLKSGGWASLAGAESFRFSSLEALQAAGPLWVLSTPEASFIAEAGTRYPYLRHAGFLPTPITAVAEEIAPPDPNNFAQAAQRVSEVLNRVFGMANQMVPAARALLEGGAAAATLTSVMQQLAAPLLRSEPMPPELLEAMPSLFKSPQPFNQAGGNDIAVRVPANRIVLAEAVMNMLVPGSSWSEVPLGRYPNPLSWAIGETKPVIAKVSIRGPLPRVKASAPLMRHLTRGAVRWMALPEIAALSRIVEMTAERVFVADEMVSTSASLKVPRPAFSPAASASVSAGLFAECYMHAACSPSLTAGAGSGAARAPQPYSVRAAWLMAAARALMMQEAMQLSSAGFAVIGYGPSHVLVAIAKRNLRSLRKALADSSLLSYPAGLRFLEERLEMARETHEMTADLRAE